ncbi:MAG: agmatine deiminase family protein, partial [Bacteroidales bacterium]
MKKLSALILFSVLLLVSSLYSQDEPSRLTHHMTPEEELRKHEIGINFTPTDPPSPPVRAVAEFEEMEGVLIRYPFGIPMSLIKEMAEDCMVKTIVANTSQQTQVQNQYQSAGVNLANCEWLIAPTDSYWTRDYGPWFVVNGNYQVGISDFPYNRPRPNDDNIPVVLAQQMGVPLYGMDLIHTGGNWMCDGMGIAASTELVWDENPSLTHAQIDTIVKDYLGIRKYHVLPDPLGDYIEHIDCWGKFLDIDKVLIGQVPPTDWRYDDFEFVANYFALQTSSYGTPFKVYRVYTPGNFPYTPYTNSLILNKKVFVPITGSQWDTQALEVYETAMPGYEVFGVMSGSWQNTDALHCRTIGIADVHMLYVEHIPLSGNKNFSLSYEMYADIIPYSGAGAITDSLKCHYKIDSGDYQSVPLVKVDNYYRYKASLPFIEPGSEVSYYLHAADFSGRTRKHPYIGEPDPHVFKVKYATDAVITPDTLVFLTVEDMLDGKSFDIYNFTNGDLVVTDVETESWGAINWYIDPWNYSLPHTMA